MERIAKTAMRLALPAALITAGAVVNRAQSAQTNEAEVHTHAELMTLTRAQAKADALRKTLEVEKKDGKIIGMTLQHWLNDSTCLKSRLPPKVVDALMEKMGAVPTAERFEFMNDWIARATASMDTASGCFNYLHGTAGSAKTFIYTLPSFTTAPTVQDISNFRVIAPVVRPSGEKVVLGDTRSSDGEVAQSSPIVIGTQKPRVVDLTHCNLGKATKGDVTGPLMLRVPLHFSIESSTKTVEACCLLRIRASQLNALKVTPALVDTLQKQVTKTLYRCGAADGINTHDDALFVSNVEAAIDGTNLIRAVWRPVNELINSQTHADSEAVVELPRGQISTNLVELRDYLASK
jgi:hypothetical protein